MLPIEERKYIAPADFVSLAFSVELSLKALAKFFNENNHREHRLEILYSYLPDQCHTDIHSALKVAGHNYPDDLLKKMLEKNSNAFVEWRYNFEGSQIQINPHFLAIFAEAILSVVSDYNSQSKVELGS